MGLPSVLDAIPDTEKTPLIVFAAGSFIVPFQHLETAYERLNPHIDIQAQYHGSIQVMRHATELHEPIDVVATADASLIPMLMYVQQTIRIPDYPMQIGISDLRATTFQLHIYQPAATQMR